MSTAAVDAAPPAAKGGKKKLIIIAAVAALVLVGGGVAAMMLMKKKAADVEASAAEGDDAAPAKHSTAAKHDPSHPPVFVPLDPFTVNLADREAERYAQVGITLEIDDAKTGEQIKIYMPAIRNQILMVIADRTAAELLGRDGKVKLAERVRRETSRALGVEVEDDEPAAAAHDDEADAKPAKAAPKKAAKKKKAAPVLPIKAVHFSNFIIQ